MFYFIFSCFFLSQPLGSLIYDSKEQCRSEALSLTLPTKLQIQIYAKVLIKQTSVFILVDNNNLPWSAFCVFTVLKPKNPFATVKPDCP